MVVVVAAEGIDYQLSELEREIWRYDERGA